MIVFFSAVIEPTVLSRTKKDYIADTLIFLPYYGKIFNLSVHGGTAHGGG